MELKKKKVVYVEDCLCKWEGNYEGIEVNLICIFIYLGRWKIIRDFFFYLGRGYRNVVLISGVKVGV